LSTARFFLKTFALKSRCRRKTAWK